MPISEVPSADLYEQVEEWGVDDFVQPDMLVEIGALDCCREVQ
jgi:hypothetical protein